MPTLESSLLMGNPLSRPLPAPAAPAANAADKVQAAWEAAKEFESVFLTAMLENMFAGLETAPPFGGGEAEKSYRSLLLGEYAKAISQSGGIGVAPFVAQELLALQDVGQGADKTPSFPSR